MGTKKTEHLIAINRRFKARSALNVAVIYDGGSMMAGHFCTLSGAQAMADLFETVSSLPFADIGTKITANNEHISDENFGKERVLHFLTKLLSTTDAQKVA